MDFGHLNRISRNQPAINLPVRWISKLSGKEIVGEDERGARALCSDVDVL